MRYSTEHKPRTRARILDAAVKSFKERGFDGINIAALMDKVGLTHGGFYAHFKNKEQLAQEACRESFVASAELLGKRARQLDELRGGSRLANFLEVYLSPEHLREPALGCPIPVFSTELSRVRSKRLRLTFEKELLVYAEHLKSFLSPTLKEVSVEDALVVVSAAAGALMMARAIEDESLQQKILISARKRIQNMMSE